MRQQLLADGSQALHAAPARAAALDQPGTRQLLEFGQGLGHGRLTQRQPLRGPRQMALLRDRDHAAQVAQLDVAGEDGCGFQLPTVMKNG